MSHDWWNWKQLGVFYFINQRFSEAERCFREVIRLTPDSAKAYSNLGGAYAAMGRVNEAVAQFKKSLSLSLTIDASNNLGYIYYWQGHYARAAEQFRNATRIAPGNALFWGNLGDAYRWDPTLAVKAPETFRHAIDLAQREIAVNPRDGQLHSKIATWWAALGARKEAASEIERAVETAPGDGLVHFNAALVYEQLGQRARALDALRAAVRAGYPPAEIRKTRLLINLRGDPRYPSVVNPGKSAPITTRPIRTRSAAAGSGRAAALSRMRRSTLMRTRRRRGSPARRSSRRRRFTVPIFGSLFCRTRPCARRRLRMTCCFNFCRPPMKPPQIWRIGIVSR